MSEICKKCNSPVGPDYIVNERGEIFCSEDCREQYGETQRENDPDYPVDEYHPYHFSYMSIRVIYLGWLGSWEERLRGLDTHQIFEADNMLYEIEEDIWDYKDFVLTKGDDGVFAHEIYLYTEKLRDLQQKILKWRPNRDKYYYISIYEDTPDFENKLKKIGERDWQDLLEHKHPYHENAFVYDDEYFFAQAKESLMEVFTEEDTYECEAYLCEGGCGDIIDVADGMTREGWIFCNSCGRDKEPGIFTIEEYKKELKFYEDNPEYLEKDSRWEQWAYFKRKLLRTAKKYDLDLPEWFDIGLGVDAVY